VSSKKTHAILQDKSGKTPLALAEARKAPEDIIALLKRAGTKPIIFSHLYRSWMLFIEVYTRLKSRKSEKSS
jgi:hypothetical protein